MDTKGLLTSLVVGALAGWIAGAISRGRGFGLVMNLVLGIVGGLIGGFLFDLVGLRATGFLGSLVCCVAGAMVVLWIAGRLRGK